MIRGTFLIAKAGFRKRIERRKRRFGISYSGL